jgi:hypothetical protein
VPAPAGHRSFSDLAFVGREGELARLRAAVAGFGVVTLAGPAGAQRQGRYRAELVVGCALSRRFRRDR